MRPCGRGECEPVAECLQAEVEQPFRLAFLMRDKAYDVLVQAGRNKVGVDVGSESVFIFARGSPFYRRAVGLAALLLVSLVHIRNNNAGQPYSVYYVSGQCRGYLHHACAPRTVGAAESGAVRGAYGKVYVEHYARYDKPFGNPEKPSGNPVERPQVQCRHGSAEKPRQQPYAHVGGDEHHRVADYSQSGFVLGAVAHHHVGHCAAEKAAYENRGQKCRYGAYLRHYPPQGARHGRQHNDSQ